MTAMGLALALSAPALAEGDARRLTDPDERGGAERPNPGPAIALFASLSLSQLPSPPLTIMADASGSRDTSGYSIIRYQFDFGDGTPGDTVAAPISEAQHTYATPGSYTITLTVTNTGGVTSSPVSAAIDVAAPDYAPVAVLTVEQLASPPLTVSADASGSTDTDATPIASYTFDFGDGTPADTVAAPTATAQHSYAAAGSYSVTLIATDTGGLTSSPVTAVIDVAAPDYPPVAALSVTQLASPPLTVSADASGSTDTDATPIASYAFDFGDGTPVDTVAAPTATAQHTYATAGSYSVTLTATDAGGLVSAPVTATLDVVAPDDPPVAVLTVTQLAIPPLTVSADASGSTDTDATPIDEYEFDFGDGSNGVETHAPTAIAQHTYAAAGTYTVKLKVRDTAHNQSNTVSVVIEVVPDDPPVAALTLAQLASPPLTVSADASGSTDTDLTPILRYQFDFGDGTPMDTTTAPTAAAQHTYAAAGQYTVTLTATDTGGLTSSPATATIEIVAPDYAPVAALTVAQLASPPLTVSADASGSSDTDATPIARYEFNFGDGTPVDTTIAPNAIRQHTYAAAGTYTVTLTATDTGNHTSNPVSRMIDVIPSTPTILEQRVAASSDDAEERSDGTMSLTSTDLELIHDATDQTVGMRWPGQSIPAGAIVTAAYIQFSSKESQSEATNLTLRAQAADDAATFTNASGNVSTRPRTSASVSWSPPTWTSSGAGASQRTPDLSAPIQEVVNRQGWASGHSIAVIITGTGHRTAWAWDGRPTSAPLLHVEYVQGAPPDYPPTASLIAWQLSSPALTVMADGSGSSDTDATPIASYRFDFGDGTEPVVTIAPTATAQHTYAAAGSYTVTLTATDTGNRTSSPATDNVLVSESGGPKIAVYAGYYDTHHPANSRPKPDPWRNSPNTLFVGQQDNQSGDPPGGGWDTSALRVDNLTPSTLTGVVVSADIGNHHYALWGSNSIPPGYHLILAQTAFENFDGSDLYPAGCYGCDTSLCTTMRSNEVPVIHVTIAGASADYPDTGQTINTDGYDAAGCPYVGGPLPETRYDESRQWVRVWPSVGGGLRAGEVAPGSAGAAAGGGDASAAGPGAALPLRAAPRVLWLSPPVPNPSHGELSLRFTTPHTGPVWLGVYDASGRLVRRVMDGVLEPGEYHVRLELGHAPPGIYFVRLWTPEASRNEKVVLVN